MIIEVDMTIDDLMNKVNSGEKYFYRIDFGEGEIENQNFDNLIFKECMLSIKTLNSTLRNTKFISSNIKASIFLKSDLTNMVIEGCSVESVVFQSSVLDGLTFINNYCYSHVINQDNIKDFVSQETK